LQTSAVHVAGCHVAVGIVHVGISIRERRNP
jgi:hypothetical protein